MGLPRKGRPRRRPSPMNPGQRQHLFPKMGTIVVVADSTLVRLGSIAERRWGLLTTAQAEDAGVSRKQLARMASAGAIERVAQGVYRMAGAPRQDHEAIYATSLALGGATYSGVFTLLPILTGNGRAHHGDILRSVADLADAGKITPILDPQPYSLAAVADAHRAVAAGTAHGKVVVHVRGVARKS